jgi:hypothetical protein
MGPCYVVVLSESPMRNLGIPQIRMGLRKRRTWALEKLVIERFCLHSVQGAATKRELCWAIGVWPLPKSSLGLARTALVRSW